MKVVRKLILKSDSMFHLCKCVYVIAIVREKQIIFMSTNKPNGLVI